MVNTEHKTPMTIQDRLFYLSVFLITICFCTEIAVLFVGIPKTVPEILVGRVLGHLENGAATVLIYWFGTTHGSARKDELLHKSRPIKPSV